jgi:hypothetical protein
VEALEKESEALKTQIPTRCFQWQHVDNFGISKQRRRHRQVKGALSQDNKLAVVHAAWGARCSTIKKQGKKSLEVTLERIKCLEAEMNLPHNKITDLNKEIFEDKHLRWAQEGWLQDSRAANEGNIQTIQNMLSTARHIGSLDSKRQIETAATNILHSGLGGAHINVESALASQRFECEKRMREMTSQYEMQELDLKATI